MSSAWPDDLPSVPSAEPTHWLDLAPGDAASTPTDRDDLAFVYVAPDDLADGQRWSTWSSVERGMHGPDPLPDWVVTEEAAIDTELGIVKTGKEGDVFLVERAVPGHPDRSSLLAAKRYRDGDHRGFHRSADYTMGRKSRRSRDNRAIAKKSAYGRQAAQGQWAWAEFTTLSRLWVHGMPVPYPVQIDGTELLMEFISVDGAAAPRLAQTRPDVTLLASYFDQLRDAMLTLGALGLTHGDLSAFNLLAQGDRLVMIDLPQVVDLVGNPKGMEFALRDCHNVCSWFRGRGLEVDEQDLFAEVVAAAIGA